VVPALSDGGGPPAGTVSAGPGLAALLDRFVAGTMGAEDALLASADGICLAVSHRLPAAIADQFGAIAVGLVSLAGGAARCFAEDGPTRITIDLPNSQLLLAEVNERAVLGAVARRDADVVAVAYELTLLAEHLAPILSDDLVADLQRALSI
jgi:predicted regulator of Ras-like GTPase activity (Roadblock/LC7/MglB family)